jgi:phosphatidylserine/phosphatidylglycerophosphate/cardiolipin synthase-like enzyme
MNSLCDAIAGLALDLHPDRIAVIARALEEAETRQIANSLRHLAGPAASAHISRIEQALAVSSPLSGREVAMMLRAAGATASVMSRLGVELVWTGPTTGFVPIRKTEQVLMGLIEDARQRVFVVSFVAHDIAGVLQALNDATGRGVEVRILLERSQEEGGTLSFDPVSKVKAAVPRATFFAWHGLDSDDGRQGAVHAKCAVADGTAAFITSANLTGAAMQRNMELGVLIRGGMAPAQLEQHLNALVTTKLITPL